jgi:hypothetical protein
MSNGDLFAPLAIAPGSVIPGTTTLASLLDLVYATRSSNLASASATFVAVSPQVISARWAGTQSMVNIALTPRIVEPDEISVDVSPTLTSITPNTGPHNTAVTIAVVGTNFDPGAILIFGTAWASPSAPATPTGMSVDLGAAALPDAGTIMVNVRNSDGSDSNSLPFTAT